MVIFTITLIVSAILGALFYFIPTAVAMNRQAAARKMVFFINFLFGWTGLGWLGALIIACTSEVDRSANLAEKSTWWL